MKKSRRLTIDDRMIIQACIHDKRNITQIATRLKVAPSTISREIKKHKVIKPSAFEKCRSRDALGLCNSCLHKTCSKDKHYYDYAVAQIKSDNLKRSSRSKPKLSEDRIKVIDTLVKEGVHLGQSLHHIYVSHPILAKICVERTIRRLCYRGNLSIRPHELRRYVTYRHAYIKTPEQTRLRDIRVLIGRTFKDYLNYVNHHKSMNVVHYDSVIGSINDKKALLTIAFPRYNFQFGLLINKGSPVSTRGQIKRLLTRIGSEKAKKIFPINLADNGTEFSFFNEIENDANGEKICSTFFTNPYRSTDKAAYERNHEFIRYLIPKGKSLDFLSQDKVDEIFSNINSYVRSSKGDRTPYDLVKAKFGKDFLKAINIRRIPNKKVRLTQLA